MYLHVKKVGEMPEDLEHGDPFALVADGRVELTHSECVGGRMTLEKDGDAVTLACTRCDARQELEAGEAGEALRRVLLYDEYAWAGDAGLLPD